ncbi:MAG TPA: hypothetical protein VIY73_26695, partial [Polyangiaceae bacterium]
MRVALLAVLPVAASCAAPVAYPTNTVGMRFERVNLYDAPFPSDDLVNADGTIAIDTFPNLPDPDEVALVVQMKQMVASNARGFSEEAAVYFELGGAAHPINLPDMPTSVTPQANVFLMDVMPGSPDYLQRTPVTVRFDAIGGPFGVPNMLTVLPLQGTPLRPKTTYAAVVTTATGLEAGDEMGQIASGIRPAALSEAAFAEYWAAMASLAQAGVAASEVAGLSVYTTDDPTTQLGTVLADMLSRPLPAIDTPFHQTDLFDTYCVYEATLPMPDYQAGDSPYTFEDSGGGWQFDASGNPILQRTEEAGVVVTIPRAPMPASGWPIAHFIRTGGGTNRPLVDRGPEATNGGNPIAPGTGPALWFTMAGMAGAMVDGPHEDLRNLTNDNEDFLMFNINNLEALRDNVRESAAEYALFAHVLAGLSLDVSDCPGTTGPAHFDSSKMALMGHSMGSTIAPLVLAAEPMYRAAVLSGAGASWIENIIWKQLPTPIRPFVNLELRYNDLDPPIDVQEDDPVVSLFQWAAEPADPLVYTRQLIREPPAGQSPRQVLMEQGIVDHYIMPPIANATSLSLGLDLAGAPLDASSTELTADGAPTLEGVLAFSGHHQIALPVTGNQATGLTGVVVQHPSDGIEDGHEMVFQTDPPKR